MFSSAQHIFDGPTDWGYVATNTFYTGNWGHIWFAGMDLMTYAPFFIGYAAHFHLSGYRMECDDYEPSDASDTHAGYWFTWVR